MALKDIATLTQEINAAVHPGGGPPLIKGADLNTVLMSLATEVVGAGDLPPIGDWVAIQKALQQELYAGGVPVEHHFAAGELMTVGSQGLFRCIQAYSMSYNEEEELIDSHYPPSAPAYWQQILRVGDDLFVTRTAFDNYLTYKEARSGTGSSSVIVANHTLLNVASGPGAVAVGGYNNSAAANLGTVVGGERLVLPEGAYNSVVLGGQDFAAPARPNTVFAPRLVLWEKGATLDLTDPAGTAHGLGVSEAGALTLDGAPAVGTPPLDYSVQTNYFAEVNPDTHRVPLSLPYYYDQPATLPPPVLQEGGYVVPLRGYYDISARALLEPGQLSPAESFGICAGPDLDWMFQVWVDGSAAPRNLTAYTSRQMLLEAGTVVYLFAQFTGAPAKVLGHMTLYLLHAYPS